MKTKRRLLGQKVYRRKFYSTDIPTVERLADKLLNDELQKFGKLRRDMFFYDISNGPKHNKDREYREFRKYRKNKNLRFEQMEDAQ